MAMAKTPSLNDSSRLEPVRRVPEEEALVSSDGSVVATVQA